MKKNYNLFTRMLLPILIIGGSSFILNAQTPIGNRADLEAISNNLSGNYILTADIDLSGADWVPLGSNANKFVGTLDGNGHIITGLRYNNTNSDNIDYPGGSRKVGLFSVIGSNGVVKKLGFEKANVVGGKHVGVIAGTLDGTAVVEKCYVGNSYIETGDHGGSIAGNIFNGAIIRNCYSNAEVYSRNNQAGGLVGVFNNNNTTISKSYFSGVVRSGNAAGIVTIRDAAKPTIEYCLNLASYVLGSSNLRVVAAEDCNRTALYSLENTFTSSDKNNFVTTGTVPTGDENYGDTKRHGANVPGGDANAKSAGQTAFYENVLNWDFTNTWKFLGDGYPVLQWQTTQAVGIICFLNPNKTVNENATYSLASGESIDFTGLLVKNQSVNLTLSTTNSKVTITGNVVSVESSVIISIPEIATITLTPNSSDFTCEQTIKILLVPAAGVISISNIEQFKAISSLPGRDYQLTADLDFSGETDFAGVCSTNSRFTGTFDGNGHVIRNFLINRPSVEGVGLFNGVGTGAVIKKLGIEGASVIGSKQAGAIAGDVIGATIEEVYVADSYIRSTDHAGSIAGRLRDLAVLQNSYANSVVDNNGAQAGGLVGVIQSSTVTKSYFAGTVASTSNRANAIVCLVDGLRSEVGNAKAQINNNVALSPYLSRNSTEADRFYRIVHQGSTDNSRVDLANNYALSTIKMSDNQGSTWSTRTSADAASQDGADITFESARTQSFYQGLGWDFTAVWQMQGAAYPVLKWQTPAIDAWNIIRESASLTYPNTLDLNEIVKSTHGLELSYTTSNTDIAITNGVISFNNQITSPTDVVITITSVNSGFNVVAPVSITVNLFPQLPILISTPADLALLGSAPTLEFKLANDIDMTGETFTPVAEFKGVLDGDGKVIKGLTYSDSGSNNVGLFRVLTNATIENLGLENVNFNGNNDVGGIAGKTSGTTTIENCYVSNSYIEGRDHVAAIVGGLNEDGTIKNCYANAYVYSREHQAGGISGIMKRRSKIENSYFAGIVSNPQNRAVGIGGYQDDGDAPAGEYPTVQNSVCLAPYLLSGNYTNDAVRILHDNSNRPKVLVNNYGLNTTWVGKLDFSEGNVISTDNANYGADKTQGANVLLSEVKSQDWFVDANLNWDFVNAWKFSTDGYPILKWQNAVVNASVLINKTEGYDLSKDNTEGIDIATLIPNTHGIAYTVTAADASKLTVNGTVVTVAAAWNGTTTESVNVNLTATDANFNLTAVVKINLIPSAQHVDATLSTLSVGEGVLVPAFDPSVTDYEVFVAGDLASVNITATTNQVSATIANESSVTGSQAVNHYSAKVFTYSVTSANGLETKNYTLTVYSGLISVSDESGKGKRITNIHSATGGASDNESPYRLLLGRKINKLSNDNKWCPTSAESQPYVIFGLADIYNVGAIGFRDKGYREDTNGQIADYKIEVSMDATNWTEVVNVTGQGSVVEKYETFTPEECRYVKFTPTKTENAAWIYGFDIFGTYVRPSDANVISRGKTIVDFNGSWSFRERACNIIDGIESSLWAKHKDNDTEDLWVIIDLEDDYNITGFKITDGEDWITGYSVYTSMTNNGSDWTTAFSKLDYPQQDVVKEGTLESSVAARYLKLEIPADNRTSWTRIKEFEAYGSKVITGTDQVVENGINVKVFQNASGHIVVELNEDVLGNVQVHNIIGQELFNQKLVDKVTIINQQFSQGIYLVTVTNNGKSQTTKIILR